MYYDTRYTHTIKLWIIFRDFNDSVNHHNDFDFKSFGKRLFWKTVIMISSHFSKP